MRKKNIILRYEERAKKIKKEIDPIFEEIEKVDVETKQKIEKIDNKIEKLAVQIFGEIKQINIKLNSSLLHITESKINSEQNRKILEGNGQEGLIKKVNKHEKIIHEVMAVFNFLKYIFVAILIPLLAIFVKVFWK